MFKTQIEICKSYLTKTLDINSWINDELPNFFEANENKKMLKKFKKNINKVESIANILGIIALALKKTKSFTKRGKELTLRSSQILSLLIFIDNHESQEKTEREKQKEL